MSDAVVVKEKRRRGAPARTVPAGTPTVHVAMPGVGPAVVVMHPRPRCSESATGSAPRPRGSLKGETVAWLPRKVSVIRREASRSHVGARSTGPNDGPQL